MIVAVDVAQGQVRVLEPLLLTRLAVQADGPAPEVDAVLGQLSSVEGDHVWLRVAELRRRARPPDAGASWDAQFDAMVRYAAKHGWTDPGQRLVRAHLTTRPEQEE